MEAMKGSRKLVIGLFLVALGCLVDSYSHNGLSNNLLSLLEWVGGLFFLGNGVEHAACAITARAQAKTATADEAEDEDGSAPPPVVYVPSSPNYDELKAQLQAVQAGNEAVQTTLLGIVKRLWGQETAGGPQA